jgi:hypothetical protein
LWLPTSSLPGLTRQSIQAEKSADYSYPLKVSCGVLARIYSQKFMPS